MCSGNQYKLKNIINLIQQLTNSKSEVIFDKKLNRTTSNGFICGDNTKIKNISGVSNFTDINEGLIKTIKFLNEL